MKTSVLLRAVTLTALLSLSLTACSQEEDGSTARLEADAYLSVAEIYMQQGQFRAGIIEAQNALQALPEYDKTRRFIAELYIEMGDYTSALEVLDQLLNAYPEDEEAALLLAEAQLNSGTPNQVLDTLEGIQADTDESRVQAYWLEGNAYARINNQTAAQESLNSALEIDPQHTPTLVTLSILEFQAGNEFGARQFLDQASEADPANLDMLIWQGQLALIGERYDESEAAFFEALRIMGEYDTMTAKRLSVMRAIILPLQMQQKNDEALRYSQIIDETPQGQFQNSLTTAMSMFQEGNYVQAEEAISTLLTQAPDHAGSNILLGLTQYAQGNLQGAEESLVKLVNAQTSSPEVIRVLAATHLRLGQTERAQSTLQEAAEQYPDDSSLLAMLAITEQSLGNPELAVELLQRAIEINSESADLHFALAGSYFAMEDVQSTIEQLMRTIELEPDYNQAKVTLVDLLINSERADEASTHVDEWLDEDSSSVVNLNVAGRMEFNRNDLDAAKAHFESSLQVDPSNIETRLFLARISLQQENYELANSHFLQVLADSPTNFEALSGLLALGDASDTVDAKIAVIERITAEQESEFIPPLALAQYHLSRNEIDPAYPYAQTAYERNVNNFTESTLLDLTVRLANQARSREDLVLARTLTDKALGLRPDNIQVLLLAAGLETQNENYSAARSHIDRIKELEPEGSTLGVELNGDLAAEELDFESALAAYRQAWDIAASPDLGLKIHRTLNVLERIAESRQFLEEWVVESPEEPTANLLLGMTLQEQGDNDGAIAAYEVAISTQSENIVLLNNLAWLYQDSDPERALELAARGAKLYSENADVLDTYGWILLKQNEKDHAIQVLERALELNPDSTEIAEHLEQARQ